MLGRTDSRGRLLLLFFVLTLLSSGMVMRLAYWQVNQHERLTALADQTSTVRAVAAGQARHHLRPDGHDRSGRDDLPLPSDRRPSRHDPGRSGSAMPTH